ncbi:uncharacterized protein LOC135134834 [Zophobas morio]|uniref:uncharacterized protein LOC135134834 n=1 Tax=Zophobas morio TaxID=2755281 RepID=UPI0030832CB9
MAYLLYTGFAAAITSILVENLGANANLNNVNIESLHLISPECTRSYIKDFQRHFLVTEYVNNLGELFEQLDKNNRIGVGPEISLQQYMVNNFNSDRLSEFQTMKLDITYSQGFLTLRNNPWRKIVDKHIVALDESGILKKMLQKNLRPVSNFNQNSGYSSASKEHVGSASVLFLGGVIIALVFFVAELVLYLYKRGQKHNQKKTKN